MRHAVAVWSLKHVARHGIRYIDVVGAFADCSVECPGLLGAVVDAVANGGICCILKVRVGRAIYSRPRGSTLAHPGRVDQPPFEVGVQRRADCGRCRVTTGLCSHCRALTDDCANAGELAGQVHPIGQRPETAHGFRATAIASGVGQHGSVSTIDGNRNAANRPLRSATGPERIVDAVGQCAAEH